MSTVPTIEECRDYLSSAYEQPDGRTKSVLDHLSMLLLKVLEERPDNALGLFEQISTDVKGMRKGGAVDEPYTAPANVAWAESIKNLTGPPKEPVDGEEAGEPETVREIDGEGLNITNLVQEAAMFDAAGVGAGFSRLNAVALFTGMRKLANKEPVKSVRMFGKVLGLKRDYLICECEYSDDFEEPAPEAEEGAEEGEAPKGLPMEPPKTGVNKFIYYVAAWNDAAMCHDLSSWVKLPHVKPEALMVARKIRKSFTGLLDAPVQSYPPFPGNEADYLRCQLARIAAGANASLGGVFRLVAEAEEGAPAFELNTPSEEEGGPPGFKPLSAAELVNAENWVHHPYYASVLSGMGRCVEPEGEPLEDEAAEAARLAAVEKGEGALKALSADQKLGAGLPAWSTRKCSPMLRDHSVSVVLSNRWPGAMCVAQGARYANIYVGHGHKYVPGCFQAFAPPMMAEECAEDQAKEVDDEPVPLPPPEPEEGADE